MLEELAPEFGCHVALTGGCLYKDGNRKDCDIILYRIRQWKAIEWPKFRALLESLHGFVFETVKSEQQWLFKAKTAKGYSIDFLFPEFKGLSAIKTDDEILDDYGL